MASEDNFRGLLDKTSFHLARGQQQTVTLSNLVVPNRPEGSKVKFTITVRK